MVKAAVLYKANEPMVVSDLEQQGPQHGEVLIRVAAGGVCASDHHIMMGQTSFPLPMVLGHEGAGVVEQVGAGVANVAAGDRCVLSFVPFCGYCVMCRAGRSQMCQSHRSTGGKQFDGTLRLNDAGGAEVYQFGKLGLFAERIVVPSQSCLKMPESVSMEEAALVGCGVATGVASVIHQPGLKPGSAVVVFGAGGIGLNVVQGARLVNAHPIVVVDIHDHKLEFAKGFGATHTVNAAAGDAAAAVREITGGGADFGFEAVGYAETTEQMVASLRPAGTGVLIGLAPEGMLAKINMVDLTRNEKRLVGSYYGSANPHETFDLLFKLMGLGKINVAGLVARRYPLERVNEAFDDLHTGKRGRGVIVFGGE